MKKLFTLSLLWVAGLFSFAALPTFAQEAEEIDADTDVAILDEATDDAIVPEEEITVEAEPSIEDAITSDPEMVSELMVLQMECLTHSTIKNLQTHLMLNSKQMKKEL